MKKHRGKSGIYLIRAEKGLLEDSVWQSCLHDYPTDLLCSIREGLLEKIPGITEKFNTRSRYFGYWRGDDKDKLYIYVGKNNLRIDLCISKDDYETEIANAGFKIQYVNNFQGRVGWLTGWQIPQNMHNIDNVIHWINMAFEKNSTL